MKEFRIEMDALDLHSKLNAFIQLAPSKLRNHRDDVILQIPWHVMEAINYDMQRQMYKDYIRGHTLTQYMGYKIQLGYENAFILFHKRWIMYGPEAKELVHRKDMGLICKVEL